MRAVFALAVGGLVAIVTGLPPAHADEPPPDGLQALDVLDRTAKVYAGCKSYRDTGVVTIVFVAATGDRTDERPFETTFVRPDRFRFEYTRNRRARGDRYIVWRKGEEVRTWWDVKPGVERPESLELALAAATGVSGGSAHTIPALLLPQEVGGGRLTDLKEARRAEDASLDGVECFRIEGTYGGHPVTVWIDKKSFLVRRISSTTQFDDFRTEETTTYDPSIGGEIPEEAMEFDPPEL